MSSVSRHKFVMVLYGIERPPVPDGRHPDLNFRVKVEGSSALELLQGVQQALKFYGFSVEEIGAALKDLTGGGEAFAAAKPKRRPGAGGPVTSAQLGATR